MSVKTFILCECVLLTHIFFNDGSGSFETLIPIKHFTWHNNLKYHKILLQYIDNIKLFVS